MPQASILFRGLFLAKFRRFERSERCGRFGSKNSSECAGARACALHDRILVWPAISAAAKYHNAAAPPLPHVLRLHALALLRRRPIARIVSLSSESENLAQKSLDRFSEREFNLVLLSGRRRFMELRPIAIGALDHALLISSCVQ